MDTAINIIMNEISGLNKTQNIHIQDFDKLNGSVLAEDVIAQIPLPPFPASIKGQNVENMSVVLKHFQISIL